MQFLINESDPFVNFTAADFIVPPLPPVVDNRGYIYMVQDLSAPEFIKVGRTRDMHKRLTAYNTDRPQNSVQIVAITAMFEDVVDVEKQILSTIHEVHKRIPAKGTKEWFSLSYKEDFLTLMTKAEDRFALAT